MRFRASGIENQAPRSDLTAKALTGADCMPEVTYDRVLLIDDQPQLLETMSICLLRELKCEVHCAVDREEAEALLDSYEYTLVIAAPSLTPQRLERLDLIGQAASKHGRPKIVAFF
jgi:DNA-binding NtrC family response regulator